MGFFEKLWETTSDPKETTKGGIREQLEKAPLSEPTDKVNVSISGNAAEEIIRNAMKHLDEKPVSIYTLKELVATLPVGANKETILGVMKVARISAKEIQQDGQERLEILQSLEENLKNKVKEDISNFEAEIQKAEACIEDNRQKKEAAKELLRTFQMLKSKEADEISSSLQTIQ